MQRYLFETCLIQIKQINAINMFSNLIDFNDSLLGILTRKIHQTNIISCNVKRV